VASYDVRSLRSRRGQVGSHHLVVYGYAGPNGARIPLRKNGRDVVDVPGCNGFGPDDLYRNRVQLAGSGGASSRGKWTFTQGSTPLGLATLLPNPTDAPDDAILVVNSHYFNTSSKPAMGLVRIELRLTRYDGTRRLVRSVTPIDASYDIAVPPGEIRESTGTWQADGASDPNGAEGGYRPDKDVCILLMTTHTHKRGTHVTIAYEEDATAPVTLYDPQAYDYVHPAVIALPYRGVLPSGSLLRAYTPENGRFPRRNPVSRETQRPLGRARPDPHPTTSPRARRRMNSTTDRTVTPPSCRMSHPSYTTYAEPTSLRARNSRSAPGVFPPIAVRRLHLDAHRPLAAAPDEVDLAARRGAPVADLSPGPGDRHVRAQLVQDERLQERAAFGTFEGLPSRAAERTDHPSVEEVELGMSNFLHPRAGPPRVDPDADQGVDQDVEVPLHGRARDARVTRDRRDAGDLAVRECGDLEKPGERREVAQQRLLLYLLPQVGGRVGLEDVDRGADVRSNRREGAEGQQLG
jgi:hypothetical protein